MNEDVPLIEGAVYRAFDDGPFDVTFRLIGINNHLINVEVILNKSKHKHFKNISGIRTWSEPLCWSGLKLELISSSVDVVEALFGKMQ